MNLYKATSDAHCYDQFDAFIVAANTAAEARRLVLAASNPQRGPAQRWRISRLVVPKRPGIVLGSFNAS